MVQPYNGISVRDLPEASWRKSRRSSPNGNCVEIAALAGDVTVAVRDSKDPDGPALVYPAPAFRGFIAGVRTGTFRKADP